MANEIWKPIIIDGIDYTGLYEVSNLGRVKSLNYKNTGEEGILKPYKLKSGYYQIILHKNRKNKGYYIHRLVATMFIPNPENKEFVDHIIPVSMGGKNEVENLRWVTSYENRHNPLTEENCKGYEHTDEAKQKIGDKAKERYEDKENHPNYMKPMSEEQKQKISDTRIKNGVAKGTNNPNVKIFICIFSDGSKTEPMYQKELAEYLNTNTVTLRKIINMKDVFVSKRKETKHLNGIQIIEV